MDDDSVFASAENSDCTIISQTDTCSAIVRPSTTVTNTPDIFFVGYTHNPGKKCIPSLPVDNKCNMEINNCTYRISGIVYLKSHHYWCEVYSSQKNCKSGWFAYNGLWNYDRATFVGLRPLFLEKESLYYKRL